MQNLSQLNPNHSIRSLKICTWNARSIVNKRIKLETIIFQENLDILCITESWLNLNIRVWEVKNYYTYRFDRLDGRDGGVVILCRRKLILRIIDLGNWWQHHFEAVGVQLQTSVGNLAIISIYIPPTCQMSTDSWSRFLDHFSQYSQICLCGDFNSHFNSMWGHPRFNLNGEDLVEALDNFSLIVLNTEEPTYYNHNTSYSSILDLIISTPTIASIFNTYVLD